VPKLVGKHLSGKVAIVTGSGRGLGKAIALRLAKAGADVVVHDENEEAPRKFGESKSLEEVAEQIRATGQRSLALFGDLTVPQNCQRIVDAVLNEFGRIDILVNNAGGDIGAKAKSQNLTTFSSPNLTFMSSLTETCSPPFTCAERLCLS
jgi:3-oxoacyl-[acyl-carrier protein] reductase